MIEFKVIVAGSRTFTDYELMCDRLDKLIADKSRTHKVIIISGTADGADKYGELYANDRGYECLRMPADWKAHGRSAGYKRNVSMAEISDAVVCFWDGVSLGTKHMIDISKARNLPLRIIRY